MIKQKRPSLRKKYFLLTATAVVVLVAGIAGSIAWDRRDDAVHTNSRIDNPEASLADGQPKNPAIPTPTPDENVPGGSTGANPTTELSAPSGTFVSNHKPNLDGSPAPNRLTSTCMTVSGAKCMLTFTKDGQTKHLSEQTADKDGYISWDWTLQEVGLTQGNWKVTATATWGDQSKSVEDAVLLEVGS